MTENLEPVQDVAPEALYAMLRRAMRNTLILGMLAAAAVWIGATWRDAAMLMVGTVISAASVWEWLRLAQTINARMDKQKSGMQTGVVVVLFMLRLAIFAAAIYVSLKFLHGSGIALLCGLALAVTTVGWEGLRLLRE
ncbi:MAG TPA: ATP synthase subunit I [Terracidiphilus sp.]|nr:ATP synthase subunit I [Terracidiphilus sp.]